MEQDESRSCKNVRGEAAPETASPGKLSDEMERFSRLSSGMMECLSSLSQSLQVSLQELNGIQTAIDLKKEELKRLHDIEVAATTLQQLMEEQRIRMESFETLMQSQRHRWEDEKAQRERENSEYLENLRIQRQREEDAYRQQQALEQQKNRQRLEDELRALQLENRLKREALEKDLLQRELSLKEKELEWMRLVQELEQFMSGLASRAAKRSAPSPDASVLGCARERAPEREEPL